MYDLIISEDYCLLVSDKSKIFQREQREELRKVISLYHFPIEETRR